MSVTIIKYPKRIRTDGEISKYVALHNPILYELQRTDYENITITQSITGKVKITLSAELDSPDIISEDDFIYLKAGSLYDGVFQVSEVIDSLNYILETAFINNATGGFINLNTNRANYHLRLDILGVNISNTYYVLGSATITPTPSGFFRVDIHEWLKELEGYTNEYNYQTLNVKDENLGNMFNIRYSESFGDITAQEEHDNQRIAPINDSTRHFFVNAAKQIADQYGQNMAVYVPFPSVSANKAKWLSGFESPTLFRGYPFDLQFIYSDAISPFIVYRESEQFDLNGLSLDDNEIALDIAGAQFVNRLKMVDLNASAKRLDVFLKIVLGDVDRQYQSCYAQQYAVDYDECLSEPPIPSPPIEI